MLLECFGKCAGCFVAGCQRDVGDGALCKAELVGGAFDPEAADLAVERFAGVCGKNAMEVERRETGMGGASPILLMCRSICYLFMGKAHEDRRDVMSVEIICSSCGAEAFLSREPVYEGLTKTGEELSCSACGHVFASEAEVPFKEKERAPQVFTDADRSEKVEVFDEGENKRLCRYCAEYVVNPFMQFCSHHKKEVQATDSCNDFHQAADSVDHSPF